jgi:hypothetical protein
MAASSTWPEGVDATVRCSRCHAFSADMVRDKKRALVCRRCLNSRAVHKADMPDEIEELARGQNPAWEEE